MGHGLGLSRGAVVLGASLACACGDAVRPGPLATVAPALASHEVARAFAPRPIDTYYLVLEGEPAVALVAPGEPLSEPGIRARVRARLAELAQARGRLRPAVEAAGGRVVGELARLANAFVVVAPAGAVERLEALAGVARVERVPEVRRALASAVPHVGAPVAWQTAGGLTGEGVRLGLVDSGIDYTHSDFGGSGDPAAYAANDPTIVEAASFPTARVIGGFDLVGDAYDASDPNKTTPAPDPDPLDCTNPSEGISGGHGTHVAGIAAGGGVDAKGKSYTGPYDASLDLGALLIAPGVAPRASLYALKIFGCAGTSQMLGPALERASDPNEDGDLSDRLDVVNASLGSEYAVSSELAVQALGNLAKLGTVVVATAGNEGNSFFVAAGPGAHPSVLAVAATEEPGNNAALELVASFSSRGPSAETALLKPEIAAPGVAVVSAAVGTGFKQRTMQGTSMAAPLVAGAVALLVQARPDAPVLERKALLMASSTRLAGGGGVPLPATLQGAGRLDVARAVAQRVRAASGGAGTGGVVGLGFDATAAVAPSFGALVAAEPASLTREVVVTNDGPEPVTVALAVDPASVLPGVGVSVEPATLTVPAGATATATLELSLDPSALGATKPDAFTPETQAGQPRHHVAEASGWLRLSDQSPGGTGGDPSLVLPFFGAVQAAARRRAGPVAWCPPSATEPGATAFFALEGASAHPKPVATVLELGATDEEDPISAGNETRARLDLRAVGMATRSPTPARFDDVVLAFGLAVQGEWHTPARGDHRPYGVLVDRDGDRKGDFLVAADSEVGKDDFSDVLTSSVFDLATGERVGERFFLNLASRAEADTQPFFGGVLVLGARAVDLGLIDGDASFAYSAVTRDSTGKVVDQTTWVTATLGERLGIRDGGLVDGMPLYTGDAVVTIGGLGAPPAGQLLILHHNNVRGERYEIVDLAGAASGALRAAVALPSLIAAGGELTALLEVTNDGGAPHGGVTVTAEVSDDTTLVSATPLGSPTARCTVAGTSASCVVGSLAPGVSRSIALDLVAPVPVNVPGSITVEAGVTSAETCAAVAEATEEVPAVFDHGAHPTHGGDGCGCRVCSSRYERLPVLVALALALLWRARRRGAGRVRARPRVLSSP
jgi:subtilisin family serine protease